ncbi:hypothetical protein [Peribacillus sp. SCS-155]
MYENKYLGQRMIYIDFLLPLKTKIVKMAKTIETAAASKTMGLT